MSIRPSGLLVAYQSLPRNTIWRQVEEPMTELATNVLTYGDNLDILRRLRRSLPDASVGPISLDSPFNSNRDSNVIFRDESGNPTDAQLVAFEDTWH